MSKITITLGDGDEVDLPESASETKALKARGARGRFSVQAIRLVASSVGIAPNVIDKLITKLKASVKDADKKDA